MRVNNFAAAGDAALPHWRRTAIAAALDDALQFVAVHFDPDSRMEDIVQRVVKEVPDPAAGLRQL
jgi:hypothetical protein